MLQFITDNIIEIVASILGLLFLYLEIKENKWLWLVGFLAPFLYVYVFYKAGLYAGMSLQFYYVAVSIYGWIKWTQNNNGKEDKTLKVRHLDKRTAIIILSATVSVYSITTYILLNFDDASFPYVDAFTTSLSIIATWMLTQKILEQWLVWIVADAVSLGLYIYKGLYPTSVLFLAYTVLAVVGYYQWKRSMYECDNVAIG